MTLHDDPPVGDVGLRRPPGGGTEPAGDGPPGGLAGIRRVASRHPWWALALRAALAFGCASMAAAALLAPASERLQTSTELVGYPAWAGFSPDAYYRRYFAIVAFVLVALVVDTVMRKVLRPASAAGTAGRGVAAIDPMTPAVVSGGDDDPAVMRRSRPRRGPATAHDRQPATRVSVAGLVAAVGALLAIQAGVVADLGTAKIVAASLLVGALTWLLARTRVPDVPGDASVLQDRLVIAASVLPVLGLCVVSALTAIDAPGGQRHVNWFPAPAAVVVAVSAAVVLAVLRGRPDGTSPDLRSWGLFGVVGPVAVVLFSARIPGMLGPIDAFHEGEVLVPASAFLHGLLPWRDITLIHGWMQDMLRSLPGLGLIENSRWGALAGDQLWVNPASWVAVYAVVVRLSRQRLVVVGLFLVAIATGNGFWLGGSYGFTSRMLPFWCFLLACSAVFTRPTRVRLAAAAFLGLLSVVLTPESLILVAPAAAVLVAQLLWTRPSWSDIRRRLSGLVLGSVVGLVLLVSYLVLTDSVTGFVEWYTTFVDNHVLYGAIPVADADPYYWWAAVLALGIPLVVIVRSVLRLRSGRRFGVADWTAFALAAAAVCYYPKYLTRPDGHVFQAWTVSLPLAFYLLDVACGWVMARVRRLPEPRPRAAATAVVGAAVVVAAALALWPAYANGNLDLAGRFRSVSSVPSNGRQGYSPDEALHLTRDQFTSVQDLIRAAGGDRGIFDFSNSPALTYYMLGFPAAHRFYNISIASSPEIQQTLIRDLEKDPPPVVVWGTNAGLGSWDEVSNPVRHHHVADWIIDNYVPYATASGYEIWVRPDALAGLPDPTTLGGQRPPATDTHYPCNWGEVPQYLTDGPTAAAARSATTVPLTAVSGFEVRGWSVIDGVPAARVQARSGSTVVADVAVDRPRPDVAAALGAAAGTDGRKVLTSGYSMILDESIGTGPLDFVAIGADGRESGLGGTPGRPGSITSTVATIPGARGGIDSVAALQADGTGLFRAQLPAGADASDWIGLVTTPGDGPTQVAIGPDRSDPTTSVLFEVGADRRTTNVHAGACPQWTSMGTEALVSTSGPARPTALRLYGPS